MMQIQFGMAEYYTKFIILYFILYIVHNTHRYSSFLTRNRGILWQGIPREENRRGKWGIDRPKKELF